MKIAITGASGFIGKLLVDKLLSEGNEVNILTRNRNKFIDIKATIFEGDLNNIEVLRKFVLGVDILYHCAAEIKNEALMKDVNENGTANLIEASKNTIKQWIQLSSTGLYGVIRDGSVFEDQNYNPLNEYERTKLNSDLLVLDAANKYGFISTIVRPSNVFGPQMTNQSLFQLVKAVEKRYFFFIGKKGASANYVPVENVIEVLYLVLINKNASNKIFIISDWRTMEDFITTIAKFLDVEVPKSRLSISFMKFIAILTSFIPRNPLTLSRIEALSNRSKYETIKVENELGYKPVVSVEHTIEKLVDFYKVNKRISGL